MTRRSLAVVGVAACSACVVVPVAASGVATVVGSTAILAAIGTVAALVAGWGLQVGAAVAAGLVLAVVVQRRRRIA